MFVPSAKNKLSETIHHTALPGLFFLPTTKFTDERGYYAELTRLPELDELLERPFVPKQINLARSNTHVVRGIHAENWNKLVTVTQGTCFCAFADFRPDSPTFGQIETIVLDPDSAVHGCLFIPAGIGNSLCVVAGPVDYVYVVDQLYKDRDTSNDTAISLFDPDLSIQWPISKEQMIISKRDQAAVTLQERFARKH